MTRAPLLGLVRRANCAAERIGEVGLHLLASVTHDDDHIGSARIEDRAHGIVDERSPGQRMEHLRHRALHARALTGGEYDGCEFQHRNPLLSRHRLRVKRG